MGDWILKGFTSYLKKLKDGNSDHIFTKGSCELSLVCEDLF